MRKASLFLYIYPVKATKVILTTISILFVTLSIYLLYSSFVSEELSIRDILRAITFMVLSLILVGFRIHLIYRFKPHPIVSSLAVLSIFGIVIFYLFREPLAEYWKPLYAVCILYFSFIVYFSVPKNRRSTRITKATIALTGTYLALICAAGLEQRILYKIGAIFMLFSTLLLFAGYFFKLKKD